MAASDLAGVRIVPLTLAPDFARDPAPPPEFAGAGDVTLVSWEAYRAPDRDADALLACFEAPLSHGFSTEELAPLVFDRLRGEAVKRMHYTFIAPPSERTAGLVLRRIGAADTDESRSASPRGSLVSDLAFTSDGRILACVAACSRKDACGDATESPRFEGALAPAPPPGLFLATALSAVHHPRETGVAAVALVVAASVLLVRFRRRPRA